MNAPVDVMEVLHEWIEFHPEPCNLESLTEASCTVESLIASAKRVTDAFRALGATKSFVGEIKSRLECEESIIALDKAIKLAEGQS